MTSTPYRMKKGVSVLSDLKDGGKPIPGNYPGTDFFVNNVSGNSGNDGFDWGSAIDQVDEAITVSEADRTLRASNDQNVRNRIFVQGTATAYDALVALPSYCDIIGVGADPSGNGAGIARIGADTGVSEGILVTDSVRGLYMRGLQLQAGVGGYAFKGTNLFRSGFDDMVFTSNGSPGGAPAAGFEMGIMSGITMRNCLWNNQSSLDNQPTVGMNITGTHFHGCRIENSIIGGDVGVAIAGGTINGWGSWFKDCYIGQLSETCSIGVDDNATVGHILYINCSVQATDAFDLVNNANRIIGCYVTNAFAT